MDEAKIDNPAAGEGRGAHENHGVREGRLAAHLRPLVVKIGSSTLTTSESSIDYEYLAALADQTQQRTLCTEVVFVATKVFRKVVDTEREQRDLALGRTRVGVGLSVLTEKLLLFFS